MDSEFDAHGTLDNILEQPGSPTYKIDAAGGVMTRTFRGRISVLLSKLPSLGSSGGQTGYYLVDADIRALTPNTFGEMVLTYTNKTEALVLNGQPETTIEVDWSQIAKPLATHPKYRNLSEDDLKKIEAVVAGKAEPSEVTGELAQNLLAKRLKGVESYLVFAPVVRKISKSRQSPAVGSCGKISTPPLGVTGFVFLKTADRSSKSNYSSTWERTEEWTGADSWDTDLYT